MNLDWEEEQGDWGPVYSAARYGCKAKVHQFGKQFMILVAPAGFEPTIQGMLRGPEASLEKAKEIAAQKIEALVAPARDELRREIEAERAQALQKEIEGQRFRCIDTFTGKRLSILALDPEDVDIVDIAHSLSLRCRFNGHIQQLYSVAQHSVILARMVARDGGSPMSQLRALLHDAAEFVTGDSPGPVKHTALMAGYRAIEQGVQRAISERFGVEGGLCELGQKMHRQLFATEAFELFGGSGRGPAHNPADRRPDVSVLPWDHHGAERTFLDEFERLFNAAFAFRVATVTIEGGVA